MSPSRAPRDTDASPWGDELPLVGRRGDRDALRLLLDDAMDGRGHTLLLTGESGVGKSRLLAELSAEAHARAMLVASGRAFSVEAGVPFGAIADALSAPLLALEPGALTVLARGAEDDLRTIVPALPRGATSRPAPTGDPDGKTRLFWNLAQFLSRLAARQPLLILVDNAHWSDPSSLELLHFLARQIRGMQILLVLAYVDTGTVENPALRDVERSLLASGDATTRRIVPLTTHDLGELLQRVFALPLPEATEHAATLFSHTRGNSFFVEQALKALIAEGRIHRGTDGWVVEEATLATLPPTVLGSVHARIETLSPDARRVAEIAAIMENRASLELLESVAALDGGALVQAIEALCHRRILIEHRTASGAVYEIGHPILQSVIRGALSAARERALHAAVTTALEAIHGDRAVAHATEIARHLVRGESVGADARALHYLAAAGRDALQRRADQEAARWLSQAVEIADRLGDQVQIAALLEELGTAQQRLGATQDARQSWTRALALAEASGDQLAQARLFYQLGLEASRAGETELAIAWHREAERTALLVERLDLVVRARMLLALTLQTVGRHAEGIETVRNTLPLAESLGDPSLLARVHQSALQLYSWTGPMDAARAHGERALAFARSGGDLEIGWRTHWSLAMLEGLTGRPGGVAHHVREASRLADEIGSPVLQAMTAEIRIEYASGVGRWSEGIALAERTIPIARAVAPQATLPRLLVWTGLIVLARNETARARALFDEAWQLTGAEQVSAKGEVEGLGSANLHNIVLAHTGMSAYHLARGAWERAMQYGERGLALADQVGFVTWAIYRMIPLIIEAGLYLQRFDRVAELTHRLREQSTALGHPLGLAWADAADALLATLRDRVPDAADRLIAAADALDAIPFVFHAARLRRSAAEALDASGDPAGAVRELRRAHEVFARLGASLELRETRSRLRSLGVRLPPLAVLEGAGALTGRELEIARAAARRLSNKEIGAALGISARTVSTHLTHIFEKLEVTSRGALADRIRDDPLLGEH